MSTMITGLVGSELGTFWVETVGARYEIRLGETPLLVRYPREKPAKEGYPPPVALRDDALRLPLVHLIDCQVGKPMVALIELESGAVTTLRMTTPVLSIEADDGAPPA